MMNRVTRHHSASLPPPRLLAVSGGRAGIGATTISVNLAIALAQQGQRTVLLDADLARADVARLCSVSAAAGIADVLAGKRGIHEVLERGPGGIQLAAGSDSSHCRSLCTDRSIGRLLSQIEALGRHTDVVVIDAGSAPTDLMSRIWHAADRVLIVTTPEATAVTDAYALLKSLAASKHERSSWELVVNQANQEAQASDVQLRMDRSCRRFLGLPIARAGWIPFTGPSAAPAERLWMLKQPAPAAAALLEQLAGRMLAEQPGPESEAA